jgi:hypothetical protein
MNTEEKDEKYVRAAFTSTLLSVGGFFVLSHWVSDVIWAAGIGILLWVGIMAGISRLPQ